MQRFKLPSLKNEIIQCWIIRNGVWEFEKWIMADRLISFPLTNSRRLFFFLSFLLLHSRPSVSSISFPHHHVFIVVLCVVFHLDSLLLESRKNVILILTTNAQESENRENFPRERKSEVPDWKTRKTSVGVEIWKRWNILLPWESECGKWESKLRWFPV